MWPVVARPTQAWESNEIQKRLGKPATSIVGSHEEHRTLTLVAIDTAYLFLNIRLIKQWNKGNFLKAELVWHTQRSTNFMIYADMLNSYPKIGPQLDLTPASQLFCYDSCTYFELCRLKIYIFARNETNLDS